MRIAWNRIAWNRSGVLVLSLFTVELWAQAAPSSCAPVKFDLIEQHQIVVRGSIGPLEGLKFLIDTGSIPSMVDRKVARKLGVVTEGGIEFVSFGKKSRSLIAVLEDLRVGPFHAGNVTASVGDLSFLHGVDAVIGLDVLFRSSFGIDYEKHELRFGPVVTRQPSVLLEATPPFLTVQLTLAGKPVRLLVDTGSRRLILFERRMHDRLPVLSHHGELAMYHLAGESRLTRVILPHLEVGGSIIDRAEGFLSDASVEHYPAGIDGVLGLRVLAPKHADFDFERNRLGFD
jgi:predicted aspartyl protease